MISVIDYEAGNGSSVVNALRKIGFPAEITANPASLKNSELIVLPGVGSAPATMKSLKSKNLLSLLNDLVLEKQKPFLGICIGYQILFEASEEGEVETLGWVKGKVKKFNSNKVKVPQMGWNIVNFQENPFLTALGNSHYFYYVNSYYALPTEEGVLLGETIYDLTIGAFLRKNNIVATQFHLEKSGEVGLRLFKNIVEYFLK